MLKSIGAALAAALAATVLPVSPASAESASEPTRVLIVGDSVTQGTKGDYTWRYFFSKGLSASGANVDLVGSSTAIFDNWNWDYDGPDAYADPDFDRDHAAVWGGGVQHDGVFNSTWGLLKGFPVDEEVATHRADVVISMWGINDLGGSTAEQVEGYYRDWVARARSGNPEVDLIVAELPYTWLYEGRVVEFNARLRALAADLSTEASTITVARMEESYTREADSADNVHPNTQGQQKIARMMFTALTGSPFPGPAPVEPVEPEVVIPPTPAPEPQIAPQPDPVPAVVLAPEAPSRIKAVREGRRVKVSWWRPPGAERVEVRWGIKRRATTGTKIEVRAPRVTHLRLRAVGKGGSSPWVRVRVRVRG